MTSAGRLAGKVALVTGASRGIGRAIAEAYGREGARVIVNYVADQAAAEAVVDRIKALGSDAVAIQADSADPAALRRLFAQAGTVFDGLDIVVNNAHPGWGEGKPTELSEADIDQQLAVLKGYIIALQEAGRRVRDGGAIICISSGTTRVAVPQHCLYASIKLAIEQMARALSREVAPRGVRSVSLAPGLTRTDRIAGLDVGPVGSAPIMGAPTPFTRPGEPEEVADAAVFLASDEARWVNTTTLYVNGGAVYAQ